MCVEICNFSLTVWLYGAWLFSICYAALILGSKQIQLSNFSLLFYGELHMESMSYKRFGPNRHMAFMRPWGLGKPVQSCWKWKTESNSDLLLVGHGPFLGGSGYPSLPLILCTCGIKTKVLLACLQSKWTNYPQPVKTLTRNVRLAHLVPSSDVRSGAWLLHISSTSVALQKPNSGLGHLTALVKCLIISGTQEPATL